MTNEEIFSNVFKQLKSIASKDKKNIFYLLYYSVIEAILLLVSPLTSAFIINSVLAHASISITVLSIVVIVIFSLIAILQVIKEYIIEKFEQKIFVKNAIKVSELAINNKNNLQNKDKIDKYMNYFFDVVHIQKLFPILLLNGSSLIIKVVISLLLLLLFDVSFFVLGVVFIIIFAIMILFLGRKSPKNAVARSDAKHNAIYFLQSIPFLNDTSQSISSRLDGYLTKYISKRQQMFAIIIKQVALTFVTEGFILASFFILGGYLVFEGIVPIGEFVAAEILIISVVGALKEFIEKIDYIYDMIEGFYKIDKLSKVFESEET
ncbi:ABC transporter ATP-binding protein [Sulfurimonas sp. NW15]|uniref:ABC transporter ATP-binding protein n=1 Tax=Sulfurimonas TaxID=202746 RepID=UPI00125FFBDC|nr:ABC transporter ATP-binding protein [Sulfurimonas hydrogeniphila]